MSNASETDRFFGQAVARTSPTNIMGIVRLASECAVYFNEHRESFNHLAQKLTYVIDSVYPRSKGSPSFENKVWAIALLGAAWNGFFREALAADTKNGQEMEVLKNVIMPSLTKAVELGSEYARVGVRKIRDV